MQVRQVISKRFGVTLGRKRSSNDNYVDIITGPNGCGKTELLEVLLKHVTLMPHQSPLYQPNEWPEVNINGTPDRVVVQTFSPFSRFDAPKADDTSLTTKYTEDVVEQSKYVCAGLHRSTRNVGIGLSRKVLEDALFRLSENSDSAEILFSVLSELGFQTKFSLRYRPKIGFSKAFEANDTDQFRESLLQNLQSQNKLRPSDARLLNELNSGKGNEFLDLLRHSTDVVRNHLLPRAKSYSLPISIQNVRRDFHVIQAFALLRRLELLSLTSCRLRTNELESIDVAKTSSGQQQMLCAIFGLATSITPGCLALLDEPELSLHPAWQLKYVDALFKIIHSVHDAHIIVATHSPLVVQQAVLYGADVVQMGERTHNSAAQLRLLADTSLSIEQALVDVFDTPIAGSAHVSNEIFHAVLMGETGTDAEKSEALAKLGHLSEMYRNEKDEKTARLVRDAIRLINTPDDLPPTGDVRQ
jgi:ABC-type cobalamin/Fe3+-siderophores transport system ATPase subunit